MFYALYHRASLHGTNKRANEIMKPGNRLYTPFQRRKRMFFNLRGKTSGISSFLQNERRVHYKKFSIRQELPFIITVYSYAVYVFSHWLRQDLTNTSGNPHNLIVSL